MIIRGLDGKMTYGKAPQIGRRHVTRTRDKESPQIGRSTGSVWFATCGVCHARTWCPIEAVVVLVTRSIDWRSTNHFYASVREPGSERI